MKKKGIPSSKKKTPKRGRKPISRETAEILSYLEKYIVVDTNSYFLYIGRLQEVGDHFMTLKDADVHDCRESPSANEKYIIDSKKYGVRCNRRLVHIRLEEIISVSLLEDVIEY